MMSSSRLRKWCIPSACSSRRCGGLAGGVHPAGQEEVSVWPRPASSRIDFVNW
jgi:hypothetical protein